ncbi:FG-GAP and VCBS repeat-containing protein [Streptomyces jeddahensis]|uniref:FG-GAP repeat protein n=1 Tax=Streptomyces jeddahensis TaxID=1716141 RepID=A0A177HGY0_9ACTN|nr:FG-GAP and VCBS repeat-containing protein [Streptomyces jeddahensis]OAH09627.1 FG-GAP repeat protein [Streptomyces jeddahensis]
MRIRTTTTLAALLAAGLTPLTLTTSASAATAKHYDDFNGDGRRDLAYAHAYSGISGADGWQGGAVTVVYGGANGLDTSHTQVVHQDSPGVPGAGEEDDMFGESLTSADLNKDGYADLVVGNPTEHVGSYEYRGSVTIVWGSASGLSGGTMVTPKSAAYGHFGSDLATGDFTGDGSPDLAVIGSQEAWLYRGAFTKSGTTGSVSKIDKTDAGWSSTGLAAGKVNGDGKTDLVVLGTQFYGSEVRARAWYLKGTSTGLSSGASKTVDSDWNGGLGPNAVIGDFDKDGYGDIALGDPDESGGKGSVTIWYGTSSGPSSTRSTKLTQATSGVSGSPEADDNFAYALSAADSNGDGYADLAVGVPHEDVSGQEDQGGVHVFRGGSGGLSGSRSAWIPQSVTGTPDSYESFGHSLRLRDVNADGKADLAVAASSGGLLLPGSTTGPTATGSVELPEVGHPFVD